MVCVCVCVCVIVYGVVCCICCMLYLHPPRVPSVPGARTVLSCPHLTIPSPAVSQSIVGGGSGVRCSLVLGRRNWNDATFEIGLNPR